MAVRVLVYSGDAVLDTPLRALLEDEPGVEVLGDIPVGTTPAEAVRAEQPDVLVAAADALLPNEIQDIGQRTWLILVADESDVASTMRALALGARAVLPRPSPETLLAAVRVVALTGYFLLPEVVIPLMARAVESEEAESVRWSDLTSREYEILQLLTQDLSNTEIARKLFVSTSTVRSHVHHMLTKLGVQNRTQAVTLAYQARLVQPHEVPLSLACGS